jgi:spore germination protein KC
MKDAKKALGVFLCVLMASAATGCSGARELNALSIVVGTGIDQDNGTEGVLLTAQIVKPSQIKSGGGSSDAGGGEPGGTQSGQQAFWNLQSKGVTVFDAIRESTHQTSNKLYLPHNGIIVVGREVAEKGIDPHMDVFTRIAEPRPTTLLAVSDTTALEVLGVQPQLDILPATNIVKLIEAQRFTSQSKPTNLVDYANTALSETSALAVPLVRIVSGPQPEEKALAIKGTAVLKKGKLVGELSQEESRGCLWVTGDVESGVLPVKYKDGEVSVEIVRASSEVDVSYDGSRLRVHAKIEAAGEITENTGMNRIETEEGLDTIAQLAAKAVLGEVTDASQRLRSLSADVYGFGEMLHKKDPAQWEKAKEDWDVVFNGLDLSAEVNFHIPSAGLAAKAMPDPQE